MHLLFAQLEAVSGETLKNFMLTGAGLLATAYYAKEVFFGGRKKTRVSFEFEPVSKQEFDKHAAQNFREHEHLFTRIGEVEHGMNDRVEKKLTDLQKEAQDGREKIHNRINRISVGVARLCGRQGIPMPAEDDEI